MLHLFIGAIALTSHFIQINEKLELKYSPDAMPIVIRPNLICVDKALYDGAMLYIDKDGSQIAQTCVYTTQQKSEDLK